MSEDQKKDVTLGNKKKRIVMLSAILALLVVAITVGVVLNKKTLKKESKADNIVKTTTVYNEEYAKTMRDTKITVNSSGDIEITRNRVEDNTDGLPDAWTVLVYMCGTDLESEKGAPTKIMNEIASVGVKADELDKLNLLVQTGGTKKWHSNYGSSSDIYRWKLGEGSKYEEVGKVPLSSMGDPDTLADFLQWGLKNYPAKKTMVIFWNHGGPENAMCYDELYEQDHLSINELEYAFAKTKARGAMKGPINVMLTHTCSNGTVGLANAMAPYVNYLVTSPTYTPTYGFDYKSLVRQMIKPDEADRTPDKICWNLLNGLINYTNGKPSAYYGSYALMTYDLRKLDDFLIELNRVYKQVYERSAIDRKNAKKVYKAICVTSQYNLESNFDIACYLDSVNKILKIDTAVCRDKLLKVVVRYTLGPNIAGTCKGMAMFHPYGNLSVQQFNNYRNVAFSPYYLKYIERSAHYMEKRNFDNYKDYSWETSKYFYEENFDFLNYERQTYGNKINNEDMYNILVKNSNYARDGFVDSWKNNIEEVPLDERKEFTNIEVTEKEDTYEATITEDADEVKRVYNTIFANINDMDICLGEDASATYDEETGEVISNFKGEWIMFGDGQLLTTYYKGTVKNREEGASAIEYDEYAIPVMVNDKEATIYILENEKNLEVKYLVYESKDSMNSGYTEELKPGMKFTPIYDVWNEEEGTYETEYGEEYTYKGENDILYTTLTEEEYMYAMIVEDFLGVKGFSKEK